ncbi:MAG: GSCFA domain-containing protein [Lentisphaerota bacterium]
MNLKLSTPIGIKKSSRLFNCDSTVAGIGSCFAQYVMEQFAKLGFNVASNPNGIVYNSHSILESLKHLDKDYSEESFFQDNDLWHSWEHHGFFSSKAKEELLLRIDIARKSFLDKLKSAELFILTPSSSVVYKLISSNIITANCHKYPNHNFGVEILSKEENALNLKKSVDIIHSINPNCLIVITLSPVRHYPGNLVLNARSKANLLSAIHECVEQTPNTTYFPSYEILLDELRDYRFYADDMLHPSELARKIIFEKFIDSFFDEKAMLIIKEREKSLRLSEHKIK